MSQFIELLKQGNIDGAKDIFSKAPDHEQHQMLSACSQALNNDIQIKPQTIVVLTRELKDGNTYKDFLKAWTPPGYELNEKNNNTIHYYGIPTQVVNGINVQDPKQVISVGLISVEPHEVFTISTEYEDTDAVRREKVAQVTTKGSVAAYKVMGCYTLGK